MRTKVNAHTTIQIAFMFVHCLFPLSSSYLRNAAVTYIDDLVGEVLQSLLRSGLEDKTVVSIIGDHGWSLGEHQVHKTA